MPAALSFTCYVHLTAILQKNGQVLAYKTKIFTKVPLLWYFV